jgi:hypothetical protein
LERLLIRKQSLLVAPGFGEHFCFLEQLRDRHLIAVDAAGLGKRGERGEWTGESRMLFQVVDERGQALALMGEKRDEEPVRAPYCPAPPGLSRALPGE